MRDHTPREIAELSFGRSMPSLPTVALDVLELCQDPDSDIGGLAETLSRDPVLTSKVLRMANSAHYNRGHEVTSLHRAAVMLGLRTLKVLALGFTLANELPHHGQEGGFDLRQYWHRSLLNAVAGRSIATTLGSARREEAFVCGLLSQIGKLATAQAIPEVYERAVTIGNGWPSSAIERDLLGFPTSEVGQLILDRWGLPSTIAMAASHFDRLDALPEDLPAETRELAGVTALAVRSGSVLFEDNILESLVELREDAERTYGWLPETVDEILDSLHVGVTESADAFSVEIPAGRTYREILDQAHSELMHVTLNTVIDLEDKTTKLAELAEENEALQSRALTDVLTDLANRAALEEALEREIHRRLRGEGGSGAFGIMMIDIDKFKTINDTHGHQNGDVVIRTVAALMAKVTRSSNLLARFGGDEFCMVMPTTTHAGIEIAAERVRRTVQENPVRLDSGLEIQVTVSVGAATTDVIEDLAAGTTLIERADAALYLAKANGRNCVEIAPPAKNRARLTA